MRLLKRRIIIDLKDGNYLLINPYSGLADIIDRKTYELLKSDDIDATCESLNTLKIRGHLVEEGEEEDLCDYLKVYAEQVHKEVSSRRNHLIIPTYGCNLQCPYCYEKHLYRKDLKLHTVMDEKTVDTLFQALLFLDSHTKEKRIELYGGEPLQIKNKSIIQYILKKGDHYGYFFKVTTNGADFYHFVPLLSEFHTKEVQITIDGPKQIHDKRRFRKGGTFDDITKGIDAALEYGIPVRIRINVDSENLEYIPEFVQFYMDKGWYPKVQAHVNSVYAAECVPYSPIIPLQEVPKRIVDLFLKDGRMEVLLETFRSLNFLLGHLFLEVPFIPHFWACNAHTSLLFYDPFGDIYACGEALGRQEHKVGVYNPELKFNDNLNCWRNRTVFSIPECMECNLAFFCGGGCAYRAYTKSGSIYTPYCENVKSSLKYEVPYLYYLTKKKRENK